MRFFNAVANADLPPASKFITDARFASFDAGRLPELAAEVVAAKPDVIVTHFQKATQAAFDATKRIPIVSIAGRDPARPGVLESLHRTGGNLTGVVDDGEPFMYGKRLELLKEAFPAIQRVAVLIGTEEGVALEQIQAWRDIQAAAARLGLGLEPVLVNTWKDRAAAVDRIRALKPDGLMSVQTGGVVGWGSSGLFELPFSLRLPAVLDGVLSALAYTPLGAEQHDKAAEFVIRILNGARPGDIPLFTPKMTLTANVGIARQLGLTIAPSVVARADVVVQ